MLPLVNESPSPKAGTSPSPATKAPETPTRNTTRLVRAQPSPSGTPDPAKTKALLETEWGVFDLADRCKLSLEPWKRTIRNQGVNLAGVLTRFGEHPCAFKQGNNSSPMGAVAMHRAGSGAGLRLRRQG
jgi:hypothetical protein